MNVNCAYYLRVTEAVRKIREPNSHFWICESLCCCPYAGAFAHYCRGLKLRRLAVPDRRCSELLVEYKEERKGGMDGGRE